MRTATWGASVALSLGLAASIGSILPPETEGDLRARAKAALAQTTGEIAIAGLDQPVEVIRDRWGVPHIYAKSVGDLFFAQGFVAAQDRLWQLDLWRRTAEGKLAEILGPSAVARDTFARLLRYRGDMEAEFRSYHPDARQIIEAFVGGINAQIAIATKQPGKLPIEFQLTGLLPQPWTAEVVVSRMAGYIMTRNARSEVQRAKLAARVGPDRVAEFMPLEPHTGITVPDGLDLADINDEILAIAAGAGGPIEFSAAASPSARSGGFELRSPQQHAVDEDAAIGSNDWVVSGKLSATGKPILANDPHRPILLPSLRYTIHLHGPGWNVIGAGEPALPGIAAGHNDRIAFGFTIVGIDQQDLYVERLDPANPDRYRYKGSYEAMRVERERIAVRGEAPREVELRFTRHGPVLHVDRARQRAYALRWVGAEPGSAGYLKSLSLNTARNWPEFLEAVDGWKVPSENLVYADVDGNIGWIAAGSTPARPNWNGLLPVPGHEGKYEWNGFLKVAELPQSFNPASGLLATANHNILPAGYDKTIGYEFSAPHRFNRIIEVLRSTSKFSVADFERLQHDALSVPARAICDALRAAVRDQPIQDPERATAARALMDWNHVLSQDSPAAALYQIWVAKLSRAFVEALIEPADRPHASESISLERLIALLDAAGLSKSSGDLWVDGSARTRSDRRAPERLGRRAIVAILTGPALGQAWLEAKEKMGGDPARWAWGRIHRAFFEHPLARTPERREAFNLGDVPRGGDGTTPFATGSGPRQTNGASYREVIDLSDWDRSTTINVPGISGQPGSPHYGDLLPLWADGRYHPMIFSRAAVERHQRARLMLVPAGRRSPTPVGKAQGLPHLAAGKARALPRTGSGTPGSSTPAR